MTTERRDIGLPIEIRENEDGSKEITGYGAVFFNSDDPEGTQYKLWSDVFERIDPKAFDNALARPDDAAGLFNHDPDNLLGRVGADTLKLTVDKKGLRYAIPIDDDDPDHQRVVRKINRGDLNGSSFAFIPAAVRWDDLDEDGIEIRTILDLELFDTGPVTYPAYSGTTADVRSAVKQEYDAWKAEQKKDTDQAIQVVEDLSAAQNSRNKNRLRVIQAS